MPKYTIAVDKSYTYFLDITADNSDEAENFVNDLLIADTFDHQYLSDNPPAQITDDGFGNPVVVEEDN